MEVLHNKKYLCQQDTADIFNLSFTKDGEKFLKVPNLNPGSTW